jgi:carboxypeptidase family protein
MKRFLLLTAAILFLGMTPSAQAVEILGRVTTARGQAIGSIRVTVTDKAGAVISTSITNADGAYDIKGVAPGRYEIKLLPLTGGSLGGLSNVRVGPHGSKLDVIIIEHTPGIVLRNSAQRNAQLVRLSRKSPSAREGTSREA